MADGVGEVGVLGLLGEGYIAIDALTKMNKDDLLVFADVQFGGCVKALI